MNKELREVFSDISKLNNVLEKIYNELAELEINNKTKDKEYLDNLLLIDAIKDLIRKKFQNLSITNTEIIDFESNIANLNDLNNSNFILDIFELKENNKIRRLLMQIYLYSLKNYIVEINKTNYGLSEEDFDTTEDFEEFNNNINEDITENVRKEYDFEYAKEKVIANLLMKYLLEEINTQEDKYIKDTLIKIKYRLIYTLSTLEPQFLKDPNNFVKENLYLELYNYEVKNVIDDIEDLAIIPDLKTAKEEIEYFENIEDEFYENKDNIIKIILRSIYLKTMISLQLSSKSDRTLNRKKRNIKYKSEKTKEYINKAYTLKKDIIKPKKVDL